jgi:hypothetical protein
VAIGIECKLEKIKRVLAEMVRGVGRSAQIVQKRSECVG